MTPSAPRLMLILQLEQLPLAHAAAGRADVVVQLRDRDADARDVLEAARDLVARGVRTVVNDRVDLAVAAGAAGVHLPEDGLPVDVARALLGAGALVGVSVHVGTRFTERARGADWALFGPVWATPGKGEGVGLPALADAARRCPCPVLAIGGVDTDRAGDALDAGAHGVAVIRAAGSLDDLLAVLAR